MATFPARATVTKPVLSTVAIVVSLEDHVEKPVTSRP
jgi:hypothetical protein